MNLLFKGHQPSTSQSHHRKEKEADLDFISTLCFKQAQIEFFGVKKKKKITFKIKSYNLGLLKREIC